MMFRITSFIVATLLFLSLSLWVGCAQKSPEELQTMATEAHQAGEIDKAFGLFDKAYQERGEWLIWDFERMPDVNRLHLDPRYIALRKKMGLE